MPRRDDVSPGQTWCIRDWREMRLTVQAVDRELIDVTWERGHGPARVLIRWLLTRCELLP